MLELFRKAPTETKSKTERITTNYKLQEIVTKEAPLNVRNFKTKPPDGEWSTPYDDMIELYKVQLL